jgi:transcriptional regulator with XRE-family HTH domain
MEVGEFIRNLRSERNLLLRELASAISIDSAILSKIERGERKATKEQIEQITSYFNIENDMLKILWLSDKVIYDLKDEEPLAHQVLKVSEERINNNPKQKEE